MCFIPGLDPLTLSTVISGVGTAVSAAGSIMQGQQANAAAQAQAQALEQQRQAELQQAAFEAAGVDRRNRLAQAAARAQVGASGVGFAGSPSAVITANAGQGQLDLEAIRYGSGLRQNALTTQASLTRMQGRQQKAAGFMGALSTGIDGTSQILSQRRAIRMGQNPFA